MRTPAQALRDAIKSGAVEAWESGKLIRHKHAFTERDWVVWTGNEKEAPLFDNVSLTWSPAPAKRRIPFTQATVTKGALWNLRGGGNWDVVLGYRKEGVLFVQSEFVSYADLASSDYSIDGGATWQPGSQEVGA